MLEESGRVSGLNLLIGTMCKVIVNINLFVKGKKKIDLYSSNRES